MKTFIGGIAGIIVGFLLSVKIEWKTGKCMAYHYDKIFHPKYFK